jgi:large subunit ribosomal protein L17
MRHGKKHNHLGRTTSHRQALLSNLASSLILHKRINTTVAKAKALRVYVEPLLTKAKEDSTHSRRVVFSYLQNKFAVTELFRDVAAKIANRPGGYTRIIKIGNRPGDAAEMCMMELVDFNEMYQTEKAPAKKKATTRRRGGKKTAKPAEVAAVELTETTGEPAAETKKPKKSAVKKKSDSSEKTDKPAEE